MPRPPLKAKPPSPRIYGLLAAMEQTHIISSLITLAGIDQMVLAGMAGVRTDRVAAILQPGDTSIRIKEMWSLAYALQPKLDPLGLLPPPPPRLPM